MPKSPKGRSLRKSAAAPAARTAKVTAAKAVPKAAPSSMKRASKRAKSASAAQLAALPDEALIEQVQRQTFGFFWDGAHSVSGLSRDHLDAKGEAEDDKVTIGGSGFGVMAIIVAVERGWITRAAALERLGRMINFLIQARCYHGSFPHFMNGSTGDTIQFGRKDDGGDIVETSFLFMGLLCARQYFNGDDPVEQDLRGRIMYLWLQVEWNWYTQDGRKLLYWHWSPFNGWALDHEVHGWNECLVTYVLAAGSQKYAIDPEAYHRGFATGRHFFNGRSYYDIELPLGMPYGGPLFFTHYSFMGLDPRGLKDLYADYWEQNVRHVKINHAHCVANPGKFKGYSASCWGLSASDDPDGYVAHAPDLDNGTIAPTAALSSLPYAPKEALQAMRHFLAHHGDKLWGRYGFLDAFCESRGWYAETFLAIDQGPIVVMMENHRTGLLWKLFMSAPEVQEGLRRLRFSSPHFSA